jgi:hypothetical protein
MRPFRFALCIAAMLSACGLTVGPALASCVFLIEWNGVLYDPWSNEPPVSLGKSVGQARVPSCNDTGQAGCEREQDGSIEVFRVAGVDPHVALAAHGSAGQDLFLADGFFPQLPDHPLHTLIYGSSQRPNERARAWQCGEKIRQLTGEVVGSGTRPRVRFEGDFVRRDAGSTPLFVDVQTTIEGFDEFGLPRLLEGDMIQATVRECTASGGRYKVVPDSISPAPDALMD